jgi:hypothetical protein
MKTLIIRDLSINEELHAKAMSEVRGGFYGGWKMPSLVAEHPASSYTTNVSLTQSNSQAQQNATGNGSVTFGGGIQAYNNQQAFNVVDSGFSPMRDTLRF